MLASASIVTLVLTAGHAAEAPLPPRVNFVATPASQLHPGVTADECDCSAFQGENAGS